VSKLSALALGLGLAITTAMTAIAAPTMSIQVFDGATLIGSAINVSGGSANVVASSSNFSSVMVGGQGFPDLALPDFSTQSLQAAKSSAGSPSPTTLTVKITQQGITGYPAVSLANTFTGNTLTSNSNYTTFTIGNYVDAGNGAFATTTLLASTSYSNLGLGSYSTGPIVKTVTPGAMWSETTIYTITFTGQGSIQSSAQIIRVPEPMSMALFGAGLLGLGMVRRSRKNAV
jgi:hypothetical protein